MVAPGKLVGYPRRHPSKKTALILNGPYRDRTDDLHVANVALYLTELKARWEKVVLTRFELAPYGLKIHCPH